MKQLNYIDMQTIKAGDYSCGLAWTLWGLAIAGSLCVTGGTAAPIFIALGSYAVSTAAIPFACA